MQFRTFTINGTEFMVIGTSEAELDAKEAATRETVAVNPPPASILEDIDLSGLEDEEPEYEGQETDEALDLYRESF